MKVYLQGGILSLSKMRKHYNAHGGPLKDTYNNPEQHYDYATAEKVGGMYGLNSKHWASRDPKTGMMLKNPKHPTFNMATREDQSSGYTPFIDSSTGRYFTLRPEEYATAPNKYSLRRANLFRTGGYEGISIVPQMTYEDFPMTNYVERREVQKERAVRMDMARRLKEEENSKNHPNSGYIPATGRWYPHESVEGGERTIGYGFKLNKGNKDPLQQVVKEQGYLTDEQVEEATDSLARVYLHRARRIYDSRFGEGSFDNLGFKMQSILGDIHYNPGLTKFPSLMKSVYSGDIDGIKKHSKRYFEKKELGRNKGIEKDLDSIKNGVYQLFDY